MLSRETFLHQLATLVSFQTVTHNIEENLAALEYVESLISKKAIVTRIQNDTTHILLASTHKTKRPSYGYLVHIDVVTAQNELFTLTQRRNTVHGRGVSDMKFSIPIGVALLNEFLEEKSSSNKDESFCLAITTDEETGGFNGAHYLAESHKWRPSVLLVPDGGDNFAFVEASKGAARFSVTSKGVSTHASRPWEGKNALTPLISLAQQLQKLYPTPAKPTWETTLNIGQLHGGISTNQVCDTAVLELDYRFNEHDTAERISDELTKLAKKCDASLEVTLIMSGQPTATDTKLKIVKKFISELENASGKKVRITKTYGASDARYFSDYAIPVLMAKPNGGGIHSSDEWLDVDSTLRFYQGLRNFLFNM